MKLVCRLFVCFQIEVRTIKCTISTLRALLLLNLTNHWHLDTDLILLPFQFKMKKNTPHLFVTCIEFTIPCPYIFIFYFTSTFNIHKTKKKVQITVELRNEKKVTNTKSVSDCVQNKIWRGLLLQNSKIQRSWKFSNRQSQSKQK